MIKLDHDEVRITVKDGAIQDVQVGSDVLKKVRVFAYDYNVDESDPSHQHDENGHNCIIMSWNSKSDHDRHMKTIQDRR